MFSTTWWREPEDLDQAQQRVAELPAAGRYVLTGPPGSGKTNLLVLRARYLVRANQPDLKVITWTRLIREFIASGSVSHGLEEDQIQTFLTWGREALDRIGMSIVLEGTFDERMRQLMSALEAAAGELDTYDGLLVDETQDYQPSMIRVFAGLSDQLFFVGDERQRIYDASNALETARGYADEVIHLPYHYRNGRRICAVAQHLSGETDYVSTSRYDEDAFPSSVTLAGYPSLRDQVDALIPLLRDQMRVYPNEMLGVIIPYRDERNEAIELLRESDIEEYCQFQTRVEGYAGFDEDRPIIVCSVHGAKGLEFRAAHILGMEGFKMLPQRHLTNLAYTAVTRAKTSLSGYYTGSIPGLLRSAFLRGMDPPGTPRLQDLF